MYQRTWNTFWKQITTKTQGRAKIIGCVSKNVKYILKANHNCMYLVDKVACVVYQRTWNTFWKQITTRWNPLSTGCWLCIKEREIHFESKSQQGLKDSLVILGCVSKNVKYILKANHNICSNCILFLVVVYQRTWNTFWKQITTAKRDFDNGNKLCIKEREIHFESKSQLIIQPYQHTNCCVSKNVKYILKANHNQKSLTRIEFDVVYQRTWNTFWKQITTYWRASII